MQFIQGQGLDEVLRELKRLRTAKPVRATTAITSATRADAAGQSEALAVTQSLLSGQFHLVPPTDADDGEHDMLALSADLPAEAAGERGPGDSSVTLPGQSELSSVVRSEYQYARSVARIGVQVAGALEYANTQGILHRDIKPSNLLLDLKGTVWVTDFGLAKASEADDLTHTGDIVGTLRYMAPERFRGSCDARSDVYSLGLTLYELLTLRPAYDEHDRQRLIQLVTQEQPTRLEKLNRSVPRDLATIVHKAISPEPEHRYPTALALADDLQRFIDDKPIRARYIRPHERLLRWGRRNKAMMAAVALVSLSLVLGTAVSVWQAVRATKAKDAEHETAIGLAKANERLKKEEQATARELVRAQQAEDKAMHELFEALLAAARANRLTRQPGQHFDSLRAIQEALKLPLPEDRSLDELRTEAIACLCLPDLEVAKEWDGCPAGTSAFAVDDAFERYARDDSQGNVSIRRIADDQELFQLPGEGIPMWGYGGLEFSPDGRFLHLMWRGPQGFRGRLWRLDAAQPVAVVTGDHMHLAFRPDSQRFAVAYPDGSIRLFDAQTTREASRFPSIVPQPDAVMLRWNPRLPQLAVRSGSTCRVMSVDDGKLQAELSVPGYCAWMDWHPEGRLMAMSSDQDMKIYLYEIAGRRLVVPPLEGHKTLGIIMRFNHAGDWLASNDWNSMLRLWDTRTGRQLLAQPAHGACLAFSRDDRQLAADLGFAKVRLFGCRTCREVRTLVSRTATTPAEGYRGHGIRARDGRLLALWAQDGVALVDTLRGEEIATLSLSAGDQPLFFEPRDEALWTYGHSGVLRWPLHADPAGGRLHVGPPQTMNTSMGTIAGSNPDGQVICVQDLDGGTLLWRRATQKTVSLGPHHDVRSVAVSPNGKWAATGSHELKAGPGAKVWDAETGRHVADFPVGGFCGVRFSPDGRWLVTTGGGPRPWAVGTWQEGPKLAGPRLGADVCFTADSQLLALEGSLREVLLVMTETGQEIARLTAPEQTRLAPQAFTTDGTQLVTLGRETGALYIFDLSSIRSQLQQLGLDWDAPPLPSSPATALERLDVQVMAKP